MDVFAFASRSETQGLVLAEAMAAGVPVVALDGAGVREVLRDGENGLKLDRESEEEFSGAIASLASDAERRRAMSHAAAATAASFSKEKMAARLVELYAELIARGAAAKSIDDSSWSRARRLFAEELRILGNIAHAVTDAVL